MTLIVDSSVVLKWVIDEGDADEARAVTQAGALAAPDLLFVECANALWAMVRSTKISEAEARLALRTIEATPVRAIPSRRLVGAAQAIAFELDQTVYDSLYLAAALQERAVFVTADRRFARAAAAHPAYAASVRPLTP